MTLAVALDASQATLPSRDMFMSSASASASARLPVSIDPRGDFSAMAPPVSHTRLAAAILASVDAPNYSRNTAPNQTLHENLSLGGLEALLVCTAKKRLARRIF